MKLRKGTYFYLLVVFIALSALFKWGKAPYYGHSDFEEFYFMFMFFSGIIFWTIGHIFNHYLDKKDVAEEDQKLDTVEKEEEITS